MDDAINPATAKRFDRRRFLKMLGATAVTGLGLYGYATRIEPHWVSLVRRPLPITGLPQNWLGKTLLQISDLHVGKVVDTGYLIRTLEEAKALAPDLVVVTGDFTHGADAHDTQLLTRVLDHLPRGSRATLAILGNHDYGDSFADRSAADGVARVLETEAVTLLRYSAVDLDGLEVVGFDDAWSPNWDPDAAARLLELPAPRIVLCHNPDVCDMGVWGPHPSYTLSGHTHGGQCRPPFLPPPFLPVLNRRYTQGEFILDAKRRLYINPGLGYLMSARFNVRPELTLFTLTEAS
ncbi:MAG: metallophosphoesterase [Candidatus Sumerlaeia bacterium]|nr:metallophosphoesterase [Candidatus Sumerlaeia bacterium]